MPTLEAELWKSFICSEGRRCVSTHHGFLMLCRNSRAPLFLGSLRAPSKSQAGPPQLPCLLWFHLQGLRGSVGLQRDLKGLGCEEEGSTGVQSCILVAVGLVWFSPVADGGLG